MEPNCNSYVYVSQLGMVASLEASTGMRHLQNQIQKTK